MIFPVYKDGGRFRKFGKRYSDGLHLGHDFDVPEGTEVKAVDDGIVVKSDEINGFGGLNPAIPGGAIFIRHGNVIVLYGHVNRKVFTGDTVKKGDIIGTVRGFTYGKDYLPHLHYAKWNSPSMPPPPYGYSDNIDKWIDPMKDLNG